LLTAIFSLTYAVWQQVLDRRILLAIVQSLWLCFVIQKKGCHILKSVALCT